jgi:hypothetical protein
VYNRLRYSSGDKLGVAAHGPSSLGVDEGHAREIIRRAAALLRPGFATVVAADDCSRVAHGHEGAGDWGDDSG